MAAKPLEVTLHGREGLPAQPTQSREARLVETVCGTQLHPRRNVHRCSPMAPLPSNENEGTKTSVGAWRIPMPSTECPESAQSVCLHMTAGPSLVLQVWSGSPVDGGACMGLWPTRFVGLEKTYQLSCGCLCICLSISIQRLMLSLKSGSYCARQGDDRRTRWDSQSHPSS